MSCDRAHDGIKIAAHLAAHTAHGGHQKTAPHALSRGVAVRAVSRQVRQVRQCGRQPSPTLLGRVIGHVRFVRFVTNSAGESDRAVDTDSITRARTAQELSATQKTEER